MLPAHHPKGVIFGALIAYSRGKGLTQKKYPKIIRRYDVQGSGSLYTTSSMKCVAEYATLRAKRRFYPMTLLDVILSTILVVIYLTCLFTVCSLTFRKGYFLLGIIGIFIPVLWLVGAILPAKPGSSYSQRYEHERQTAI